MKFLVVILGLCMATTTTEACLDVHDMVAFLLQCLEQLTCNALTDQGGRIGGLLPESAGYGSTQEEQLRNLGLAPKDFDVSGPDPFASCLATQAYGLFPTKKQRLQMRLCAVCVAGIASVVGCNAADTSEMEALYPQCKAVHIIEDPIIAQFVEGEENGQQTCYMMEGNVGEIYTLYEEERQGGFQINVQLERWSLDRDPKAKYVGVLSVTEGYFVMTVDLAGLSFIGSSKGMDSMILPWGQNTFANLTDNVYVDLNHDTMDIQFGEHLSIQAMRRHSEFLNIAVDHDDPYFTNVKGILGDVAHFTKIVPDTQKGKGQAIEITDPVTGAKTRSHAKWIEHAGCTRVHDSWMMKGIFANNLKECGLYCR